MKVAVDFTGVQDGAMLVPEGDYVCKVTKVEVKQGEKGAYLACTLTIGVGQYKGQKLYRNLSTSAKSLWALRNAMICMGIDVPKSKFNVDTDAMTGKIIGVSVAVKKFEGKDKSDVVDLWKAVKTDTGWKRAEVSADEPAKRSDDDDDDIPPPSVAPTNVDEDDDDDIPI